MIPSLSAVPRLLRSLAMIACGLAVPAAAMAATQEPLTLYHAIDTPRAHPTCAVFEPGNDERLYVLEKETGDIWLYEHGAQVGKFMHIDVSTSGERGLMSMVFDPDYGTGAGKNGYFYVITSDPTTGAGILQRYTRDASDANRGDPTTRLELFRNARDLGSDIHYGSWMGFTPTALVTANPDNKHWLYITVGDAGNGTNAQSLTTRNGKILRLDVDPTRFGTQAAPYGIPSENPWKTQGAPQNEIIAIGVRNPWRGGFDRVTGDFWLCDVGATSREEVNKVPYATFTGAGAAVINLGWPAWEGLQRDTNNNLNATVPTHFPPVRDFGPGAFIGGRVYRGTALPGWVGSYIWTNYGSQMLSFLGSDPNNLRTDLKTEIDTHMGVGLGAVVSYSEDSQGELYVTVFDQGGFGGGSVMRLAPYDANKRPARFTSRPELYATKDFSYDYDVIVDGLPSVAISGETLPTGMTLTMGAAATPQHATLHWVPSALGTYQIGLKGQATGVNPAAYQNFTLTVQGPREPDVALSDSAKTAAGLDWAAFNDDPSDGYWDLIPDMNLLTPSLRGTLGTIDIPAGMQADHYAVRYQGYLKVDTEGVYKFKATADDRAKVFIAGRMIYDYDSAAARANPAPQGNISLKPGYHRFEVDFLEQAGGESITVQWMPVGSSTFSAIPAGNLARPAAGYAYGLEGYTGVVPYLGVFPATLGSGTPPAKLSQTGAFADVATLTPARGVVPFSVNAALWSDDASKQRWVALPAGQTIGFDPTGNWAFPAGTVLIKHFAIDTPQGTQRLETRFLIMSGGGAYGVTYKWNAAGTDADLDVGDAPSTAEITRADGRRQTWSFPSRTNCMECHLPASGFALGLRTHQLNGNQSYTTADGQSRTDNQLRAFGAAGLLTQPYAESAIPGYGKAVKVDDTAADITTRVRSYLDVNCAHCHQPGGVGSVALDTRFAVTATMAGILDQPASLAINGVSNLKLLASNDPDHSAIYQRMNTTDPAIRMPKLARSLIHPQAVDAVYSYIMSRNNQTVGNRPPVVNAGTDRAITLGFATGLVAQVVNVSAQPLTLAWTSTPATGISIANANTATPTVTISTLGTYTLTLTATAGGLTSSDAIVLTAQSNTAPVISLASSGIGFVGQPFALRPTVSDSDNLPSGTLTYAWSTVSGPGTVNFAPSATVRDADVTFPVGGSYVLRLTASDGQLATTADIALSIDTVVQAIDCGNAKGTPLTIGGITYGFDPLQGAGTEHVEDAPGGDFAGTTTLDAVYRTNHSGNNFSYTFTGLDTAGTYRLRVMTTEVYFTAAGNRVFNVKANGVNVKTGVDPFSLGNQKFFAGEVVTNTFSSDANGQVVANFASTSDAALVCALRLERVGGGGTQVNQPPTATAATSATAITLPTNAVTLTGTATDPEAHAMTCQWVVSSGTAANVTFSAGTALSTTATFAAAGTYGFKLQVTDDKPQTVLSSEVTVVVSPASGGNGWTVVKAIDCGKTTGRAIVADGITWDLDPVMGGDRYEGPNDFAGTTTLDEVYRSNNTGNPTYSFTGLASGTYRARVQTTEVWFTTANSRVFNVLANGTAVATGVDPFALGQALFTASEVTTATFSPDGSGAVALSFQATADQALVTAIVLEKQGGAVNQPPTATAATSVTAITLPTNAVTLTGTATDPEAHAMTYQWVVSSGTAANVTFSAGTALTTTATFSAAGTYGFKLQVTDDLPQAVLSSEVTVVVSPAAGGGGNGNSWTVVKAIDCGHKTGTAIVADGITWELDPVIGGNRYEGPTDFAGTTTLDEVYRSNNSGNSTYSFTALAAGTYRARVQTTEVWFTTVGSRKFNVLANGTAVATGIDPFALGGAKFVASEVTTATFSPDGNGAVALSFPATADQALVTAIVLEKQGAAANQPSTATASASATGITLPINAVTLTGTATDPEAHAMTYQWVVSSGTAANVTFSAGTGLSTTATFAAAGTYGFKLQVTDDLPQAVLSSEVTVVVSPAAGGGGNGNSWTVVKAIDCGHKTGTAIVADGITWELDPVIGGNRYEGPTDFAGTTTLDEVYRSNNSGNSTYSFTALAAGTYRARVQTTEVWFTTVNSRKFNVLANGVAVATGVDPFALGGAKFVASEVTTATFSPDGNGAVALTFPATADQALVTAIVLEKQGGAVNQPPTATAAANATAITLPTNAVTLTGMATDPEAHAMTYQWSVNAGVAANVTFSAPTALTSTATFAAAGTYVLRLTVTDDAPQTATADVTVVVSAAAVNQPPTATASASATGITLPTNTVTLTGTATDPEAHAMTFQWVVSSGTAANVTFSAGTALSTTATFSAAGTYGFKLQVTDDLPQTVLSSAVTVTVSPAGVATIQVNFQPSGTVPAGYVADTGAVYAARNGQTYGWNVDITADTRKRNVNADPVLDTLIHVAKNGVGKTWEMALANGIYDVEVFAGDPSYTDMTNSFDVEGQVWADPTPQSSNYDSFIIRVTVSDGKLTIKQATGGANSKLQAVKITAVPSGSG